MANASLESLPAFFEWCEQSASIDIHTHLQHLESHKIPPIHNPNLDHIQPVKLAIRSLHVISVTILDNGSQKYNNGYQEDITLDLVRTSWPHVYKWIEFLNTACVVRLHYGDTLKYASLQTMPGFLRSMGRHKNLRETVLKTRGVISMLVIGWFREKRYIQQTELVWYKCYFALALESLLHHTPHENTSLMTTVLADAPSGAISVARSAIDHLSFRLHHADITDGWHISQISFCLLCLSRFLDGDYSSLHKSMLCGGIVATTLRYLTFGQRWVVGMRSLTDPTAGQAAVARCMITGCDVVAKALCYADGPHGICHALNVGLISTLLPLELLMSVSEEFTSGILEKLFYVLRQYLPYRTVLRTLAETSRRIRDGPVADMSGPVWEHWLCLEEAVTERLVVRKQFETNIDTGYTGCDNDQCPRNSDDCKFWRCSGCLGARYCSKRCHRLCWQSHRITCKAWWERLQDGPQRQLALRDRKFLRFVALHDLSHNIRAMVESAERKFPDVPISSFFVKMSYLEYPATYGLVQTSAAAYYLNSDAEVAEKDGLLLQAKHSEGRQILVLLIVREGSVIRSFPLLADIPNKDI